MQGPFWCCSNRLGSPAVPWVYGNCRFITMITSVRHRMRYRDCWNQSNIPSKLVAFQFILTTFDLHVASIFVCVCICMCMWLGYYWGDNFFFCGASAQLGPRSPLFRFLYQTQTHTHTHPVGLLWTGDQLVAETSTWKHTTNSTENIHAFSGIQNHNPSNQETLDRAATGIGRGGKVAFHSSYTFSHIIRYK